METIEIYKSKDDGDVILPVAYPPPLRSYLPLMIVSSIVVAQQNNLTWIMHNFIQLFSYANQNKIETFPIQSFLYFPQALINCNELNEKIMDIRKIYIVEDMIKWIDEGKYPVIYLDENKIPGTRLYQKKTLLHSQLIFGYNSAQKTFKSINFINDSSKVEIIDIDFHVIEDLFYSDSQRELFYKSNTSRDLVNKGYRILILDCDITPKSYVENTINKEFILYQIHQYLYTQDSSIATSYFTGKLLGNWGIRVYEDIEKIIQEAAFDYRIFCLLIEHKAFMKIRIAIFNDNLAEKYQVIVDYALSLKNLYIKFVIDKNQATADKLVTILHNMKSEESRLLKQLF